MKTEPKRIPWTEAEDAEIVRAYNQANGAFPTYSEQAGELNREFHEGRPVRSVSALKRRWKALLT